MISLEPRDAPKPKMKLALIFVIALQLNLWHSSSFPLTCHDGCHQQSVKGKTRIAFVRRSPILKDQWWRFIKPPTGSSPQTPTQMPPPIGQTFGETVRHPQLQPFLFPRPLISPSLPFGFPQLPPFGFLPPP